MTEWEGRLAGPPASDETMSNLLAQNWWAIALRGVFAIVFGIIALLMPGAALLVFVLLFAAYICWSTASWGSLPASEPPSGMSAGDGSSLRVFSTLSQVHRCRLAGDNDRRLCFPDGRMGDCHRSAVVWRKLPPQHPAWPMAYGVGRGGLGDLGLPADHLAIDRGGAPCFLHNPLRPLPCCPTARSRSPPPRPAP